MPCRPSYDMGLVSFHWPCCDRSDGLFTWALHYTTARVVWRVYERLAVLLMQHDSGEMDDYTIDALFPPYPVRDPRRICSMSAWPQEKQTSG